MHPENKYPIHLQDDFYQEIYDPVKQGVLERVEHSTEWVNSFVIVEKDVFHGNWKFPCSRSSNQEEAMNFFRSKRSQ